MKKALLVGINKYVSAPLRGCVNDVTLFNAVLTKAGYETITLADEQATKANIISNLESIVASDATHLIFHYSGHGSQIPDRSNDETDCLDEILCPYDLITPSGRWTDNYITDDDLNTIFSKVKPTATMEVFLDCCHSGTGTRDFSIDLNDTITKFIPTPVEMLNQINPVQVRELSIKSNTNSVVTWSGCSDCQTSADAYINGSFNGAFTFCLLNSLDQQTRHNIYLNLFSLCKNMRFTQDPQLSCSPDLINQNLL